MGAYVERILMDHMDGGRMLRPGTTAKPGDERVTYGVAVPLTIPARRALEEQALREGRSLSNLATLLVLQHLHKTGSRK